MKHPASREMYAYWMAQRGHRRAPSRNDIDPAAIRGLLGDSFMVNRERTEDTVFRLAGTRICDMFSRELKGERFFSLWDIRSHADLRALLDLMVDHTQGFVAGITADVDDDTPARLELLLLPLYRADTVEARSIGTLAAFEPQRHLQLQTVSGLRLEGWRYIGAEAEASLIPRQVELPPDTEVRHGLFVVPGGRD